MYYTGTGDKGTTTLYGCDQRLSKSSAIAEALGALDEATSVLGLLHVKTKSVAMPDGTSITAVLESVQGHLFTIQAALAGTDKRLSPDAVPSLEGYVDMLARTVPPVTTFIVPGGTEESALADFTRTVVRRAERRVVAVVEEGFVDISKDTLAYVNRLSSFLFVLARYVNKEEGVGEHAPVYDK